MRLLVVAATRPEVAQLTDWLDAAVAIGPQLTRHQSGERAIDVLVTGVGMVATAVWVTRTLNGARYDAAYNFGVCGAFDPALDLGTVVHVTVDSLPELGAEDGDRFLSIAELGLLAENDPPFTGLELRGNPPRDVPSLTRLPEVRGITVNTAHGHEPSIAAVRARHQPHTESMEGAAFLYACLVSGVPCAQVRAVSNRVERRNRAAWDLPLAIRRLGDAAHAILEGR
jgi:futalosine hydrolase